MEMQSHINLTRWFQVAGQSECSTKDMAGCYFIWFGVKIVSTLETQKEKLVLAVKSCMCRQVH